MSNNNGNINSCNAGKVANIGQLIQDCDCIGIKPPIVQSQDLLSLFVAYTNGKTQTLSLPPGPKGDTGATGATGAAGADGNSEALLGNYVSDIATSTTGTFQTLRTISTTPTATTKNFTVTGDTVILKARFSASRNAQSPSKRVRLQVGSTTICATEFGFYSGTTDTIILQATLSRKDSATLRCQIQGKYISQNTVTNFLEGDLQDIPGIDFTSAINFNAQAESVVSGDITNSIFSAEIQKIIP